MTLPQHLEVELRDGRLTAVTDSDLIRIILVRAGAEAEVRLIDSNVEVLQKLVGGYFEQVVLDEDTVAMCNEDGLALELPRNERVGLPPFVGDFVIGRFHSEAGELVSMTDDDVARWMTQLALGAPLLN